MIHLEPLEKTIVFLPGIISKGSDIVKTFFVKNKIYNFHKTEAKKSKIKVISKKIIYSDNETKLEVVLENTGYLTVRDLFIFGSLLDDQMNVADLSRSYVEYMDKNERKTIIIT
jgi:hypothetical protein